MRSSIEGVSSMETGIRKPPDVRLPGSQPGPKLALSSQPMWMRPRRTTGQPWACTSSETERCGEGVGNLFLWELVKVNASQIPHAKLVKAPSRELVKAPLRRPIRYTQATQRRVLIGVERATWTTTTGRLDEAGHRKWRHGQSSRWWKHRPASTAPMASGDSKEGLNRRGARNLTNIQHIWGRPRRNHGPVGRGLDG